MTRTALRVVECCTACRRPVERCESPSCMKASTYSGILVRGAWQNVEYHSATASHAEERELATA